MNDRNQFAEMAQTRLQQHQLPPLQQQQQQQMPPEELDGPQDLGGEFA